MKKRVFLAGVLAVNNLTLTNVGERIGVSRQMVRRYIDAIANPRWETQQKMVEFFQINSDILLAISEINNNAISSNYYIATKDNKQIKIEEERRMW